MLPIKLTSLTLFVCLTFAQAPAQNELKTCLSRAIIVGSQDHLDTLTGTLLTNMKRGRFYLVGESHTFMANNDLLLALIRKLHKEGIYNVIGELPHATCFIYNEFLDTGNDSLLTSLLPVASYRLLKEVRTFNTSLPSAQRIRFYGIDYLSPDHDFSNLATSLRIIRSKISDQRSPVDTLINGYIGATKPIAAYVKVFNNSLLRELTMGSIHYQQQFGRYYYDLLLMANNMVLNRTDRDKEVFTCFKALYDILLQQGYSQPGFLSFYGIAHLFGLGELLQQDAGSPVRNEVVKIGLQYYHCLGGWSYRPEEYLETGFDYRFAKKDMAVLRSLFFDNNWTIGVIAGQTCMQPSKKKSEMDGLIIFKDYGTRRMQSWKFD